MPKKLEIATCKNCGTEIFRRAGSYFWYHKESPHRMCLIKVGNGYPVAEPKEEGCQI
jgi:hypothetical protein